MDALKLARVPRAERERVALEALESVGLAAFARRPARVLSGGEQQRLALARAWALHPEVLSLKPLGPGGIPLARPSHPVTLKRWEAPIKESGFKAD